MKIKKCKECTKKTSTLACNQLCISQIALSDFEVKFAIQERTEEYTKYIKMYTQLQPIKIQNSMGDNS